MYWIGNPCPGFFSWKNKKDGRRRQRKGREKKNRYSGRIDGYRTLEYPYAEDFGGFVNCLVAAQCGPEQACRKSKGKGSQKNRPELNLGKVGNSRLAYGTEQDPFRLAGRRPGRTGWPAMCIAMEISGQNPCQSEQPDGSYSAGEKPFPDYVHALGRKATIFSLLEKPPAGLITGRIPAGRCSGFLA